MTDREFQATIVQLNGRRADRCAGLCTQDGLTSAYRAHRSRLLGRARSMLGDAGQAEDAVQETFLRAWRACAGFDPERGPMLNWLAVILRNVALDMIKARGRRPARTGEPPNEVAAAASGLSGAEVVLLRTDLRRALAWIDAGQRAVIVETILRDRPYEDVAADLGIPVGTVKSRVHYALRRMERLIQATADAA